MKTAKNKFDELPEWCEICNRQGYFSIKDPEQSYILQCEKCKNLSSYVWCQKCGMGGPFIKEIHNRPSSWVCPECGEKYSIKQKIYSKKINLYFKAKKESKFNKLLGLSNVLLIFPFISIFIFSFNPYIYLVPLLLFTIPVLIFYRLKIGVFDFDTGNLPHPFVTISFMTISLGLCFASLKLYFVYLMPILIPFLVTCFFLLLFWFFLIGKSIMKKIQFLMILLIILPLAFGIVISINTIFKKPHPIIIKGTVMNKERGSKNSKFFTIQYLDGGADWRTMPVRNKEYNRYKQFDLIQIQEHTGLFGAKWWTILN